MISLAEATALTVLFCIAVFCGFAAMRPPSRDETWLRDWEDEDRFR